MSIVPTAASFATKSTTQQRKADDLGQADFLRLMTEQLKNQDPLKPLDSNQFLGQLAQFSTVQGIQQLQSGFNAFADAQLDDQALQAASLVGRDALVSSSNFMLQEGQPMSGMVIAPQTGTLNIEIKDGTGAVVRRFSREVSPGEQSIGWDGMTDTGTAAAPGIYEISATFGNGSDAVALETQVNAHIESVSFSRSGLLLNLAGGGAIPFSSVRRIS